MRVLVYVNHLSDHLGGGAVAMLRLASALQARGHHVTMATRRGPKSCRGLQVHRLSRSMMTLQDVVITSAYRSCRHVRRLAEKLDVPVISCVHSALQVDNELDGPATVWGSQALRDRWAEKGLNPSGHHMVMHPIIPPPEQTQRPGDAITLINLQESKGARLFYGLAEQAPHRRFLGVQGWGKQLIPDDLPANVTIMDYTEDMAEVWRETAILLYMHGENAGPDWGNGVGMAALEAAHHGIPTIAHADMPGLRESLGSAGVYVDSMEPLRWAMAILGVQMDYQLCSARSRDLAESLDPDPDLDRLERIMEEVAHG